MQVNPYLFYNGNCEAALKFFTKKCWAPRSRRCCHMRAGRKRCRRRRNGRRRSCTPKISIDGEVIMGVRRVSRALPTSRRAFSVLTAGRGPRRCRTQVQGSGGGRQRQHAVCEDLLLQGLRHVRRPVWDSLDGQLPDGAMIVYRQAG